MNEKSEIKSVIEYNNFIRTVLNSLAANIVVLDIKGNIIKTNQNWDDFNSSNEGEINKASPGVNYLDVCRRSFQSGDDSALNAAEGIEAVISGQKDIYTMEYPCHSPSEKRWFLMKVTPLKEKRPSEVVVFHIDITSRRLAEERVKAQKEELKKANQEKEEILEKGRKIHQQFLPNELPRINGLDIESFYRSAEKLGGDFYNIYKIDDKLLFYLADITGHSLDGAIINIFLREAFKNYLLFIDKDKELKPKNIIKFISEQYFKEDFPGDYFLCLLIGIYDLKIGDVKIINSGIHIPPLLIKATGESKEINCSGPPISSVVPKKLYKNLKTCNFVLRTNDILFVTTDGIVDEEKNGEFYGYDRIKSLLENSKDKRLNELKDIIIKDLKFFSGKDTGRDDITFLLFKLTKQEG